MSKGRTPIPLDLRSRVGYAIPFWETQWNPGFPLYCTFYIYNIHFNVSNGGFCVFCSGLMMVSSMWAHPLFQPG